MDMIRSVKGLRHIAVNASDGRIGYVEQVFFDDAQWTIRYLVVDTDLEVAERRVLVSPMVVTGFEETAPGAIHVRLTRRQVAESPDIDTEKPVSRQKELEYNRYFLLPTYWGAMGLWGSRALPTELMSLVLQAETPEPEPGDVHLRSSRTVIGYRVKASDGKVGHIEDFLYDDASWRICYAEVDTRNWVGGRHVIVSPTWVQSVSWDDRAISVNLPVESVRAAPDYTSPDTVTPEYEELVRSHFARFRQ